MDIRQLLEKMEEFAGQAVGQKPGDQWKGTDAAPPGKKLVGDSILKDLSKGKKDKSKEQELSEEFQAFLEAEFKDTVDKRPARKNARHSRGHEPQPRYKTVKADEGLENPHPASKDPIVAKVVKQMRPGLKNLDMGNEAFLYFAYELGKQRARDAWSDYLPAIRSAYEQELGEGWESGPEEYEEPYDDADDAYDRQRQEKIDTEAEKEWAKLPKVSTYKLIGRGPNMEPNYEFGDEFDTLEQALKYREEIMKDPKTPHPEHIGIRTITRVDNKQQTNEAFYTAPTDKEGYDAKMTALQDLQTDPNTANDEELQRKIIIYMDNLQKVAHKNGWLTQHAEESRGHKIITTKLKDVERAKKFASGELKIPTPQERQAQLKKLEKAKPVKEFVAPPPMGTANQTMQQKTQAQDPKQAQAVAQATLAMKSAIGSSAPTATLAKALDTASQGKPVAGQEASALEPLMKDMATVAQDPKLAGSFKSLVSQINQAQIKQQQQQKS